jgi:hypothetical protein
MLSMDSMRRGKKLKSVAIRFVAILAAMAGLGFLTDLIFWTMTAQFNLVGLLAGSLSGIGVAVIDYFETP